MKKSSNGFKNMIISIVSAIAALFLVKTYFFAKLFHRKKVTVNE